MFAEDLGEPDTATSPKAWQLYIDRRDQMPLKSMGRWQVTENIFFRATAN